LFGGCAARLKLGTKEEEDRIPVPLSERRKNVGIDGESNMLATFQTGRLANDAATLTSRTSIHGHIAK
jgi:hypothetical protein